MNSFIVQEVARAVLPVAILFAIYLLLRGHDAPGGGFVAGLVTTAAVILNSFATAWPRSTRQPPCIQPLVSVGLMLATGVGLVSTAMGEGFLRHYHGDIGLSRFTTLHLSTALVFDVGVYLVVVGSVITVLIAFAWEDG